MQKENLIQQARQIINDYTGQKKVSSNQLKNKLQVSGAVLSFIKNDQLEKLSEDILRQIINALKAGTDFNLIATANYNSMQRICADTQSNSQLNAVIGFTGSGKTTALYDYYLRTPFVYYLQCKNSMNRRQFLSALLAEMGVNFMGSVYDMLKQIADILNSQQKPLLIIDEAGKLSTNVLLDLHDLRNDTMYNAGIILAGCEYFQRNIEKAVTKDKTGYPEFHSRIINWNILNKPTRAEIAAICQANGVTDDSTIKDFQKLPNYRLLYNAITNERGIAE